MKVAGMTVKQSFATIAAGGSQITRASWDDYFAGMDDVLAPGKRRRRQALKPKLPQVRETQRKPRLDVGSKFKKATMKLQMINRFQKEEEEPEDEDAIRQEADDELSSLHPDRWAARNGKLNWEVG
eukprot:g1528.t1